MTTGAVTKQDIRFEFDYVNHRGDNKHYVVQPIGFSFHAVRPWYPEPTWLMRAWVPEIHDYRDFQVSKMRDIKEVKF